MPGKEQCDRACKHRDNRYEAGIGLRNAFLNEKTNSEPEEGLGANSCIASIDRATDLSASEFRASGTRLGRESRGKTNNG